MGYSSLNISELLGNTGAKQGKNKACVLWLSGLSGRDKIALPTHLKKTLFEQQGICATIIDGDELDNRISSDLGLSDPNESDSIRRISEVVKLLVESGLFAIVTCASPLDGQKQAAKEAFGSSEIIEIAVNTEQNANDVTKEQVTAPEIHIQHKHLSLQNSSNVILHYLREKGFIGNNNQ